MSENVAYDQGVALDMGGDWTGRGRGYKRGGESFPGGRHPPSEGTTGLGPRDMCHRIGLQLKNGVLGNLFPAV